MTKYHPREVSNNSFHGTGSKLVELMRAKGVSKKRLSRESGVSEATLRRMCCGNMVGSMHSWALVLDALDADYNDFFGAGIETERRNRN